MQDFNANFTNALLMAILMVLCLHDQRPPVWGQFNGLVRVLEPILLIIGCVGRATWATWLWERRQRP